MNSPFFRFVLVVSLVGMAFHYLTTIPSKWKEDSKVYQRFQATVDGYHNPQRRGLREPKAYEKAYVRHHRISEQVHANDPSPRDTLGCHCSCILNTGQEGKAMLSLDSELIDFLGGDSIICIPDNESVILLARGTGACDESCM